MIGAPIPFILGGTPENCVPLPEGDYRFSFLRHSWETPIGCASLALEAYIWRCLVRHRQCEQSTLYSTADGPMAHVRLNAPPEAN